MLKVIDDAKTIRACQAKLKQAVVSGSTEHRKHMIGYPGGVAPATIYYSKPLDFWMAFEKTATGRYFNPCGIGYPFDAGSPAPHVEINFPVSGIDRRVAGSFLCDEDGVVYVAHSGKVGGGTKGVGLKAFLAYYPAWTVVQSGDQEQPVYVLGRVDAPKLVKKLVAFTHRSKEFRDGVKAGNTGSKTGPASQAKAGDGPPTFNPEFTGKKKYTTSDLVEADCNHGTIVKALREHLVAAGLDVGNTVNRDLYVQGSKGALLALFEVKTLADTTSVYTCVGQLFFHAGQPQTGKLVAVLPDAATKGVRSRLAALGIDLVTFGWNADAPTFDGLDAVMTDIGGG
jgi:hypothetical protein